MNTKVKGNISEARLLAACVSKGWSVLVPFGDNEPYDLVIDRGNGFERVQVKTARLRNGCIEFNAYSQPGRTTTYVQNDYKEKADLFGVFSPDTNECYLIPVSDVGISKVNLRVEPPKYMSSKTRFASTYRLL